MHGNDSEAGDRSHGNGDGADKKAVTLRLERLQQYGDDWEQRVNDLLRAALDDGIISH
jgi:uncharacterized protein (DUF4415 family)